MDAVELYWKNLLQLILSACLDLNILCLFESIPKDNPVSENCMIARVCQGVRDITYSLRNKYILYWASLSIAVFVSHIRGSQSLFCTRVCREPGRRGCYSSRWASVRSRFMQAIHFVHLGRQSWETIIEDTRKSWKWESQDSKDVATSKNPDSWLL